MKKNNVQNNSREFSFINFYKHINKLSIKNKIGKELNDKIIGDITQMNFSFKNLNNNDANLFDDEEIILGNDEGFDKNSIDSFDLNKDFSEKTGFNEPKIPKK